MSFLCVSPNPAIDKRLLLAELLPGTIHRVQQVRAASGGKSAHVAMVLRTLGEDPSWIGFAGGEAGDDLISGLNALGIQTHRCRTGQRTRVNLEILEESGRVTEILEPGSGPSRPEVAEFSRACEAAFSLGGPELNVIFSGSLPAGVGEDFYALLIDKAHSFGCRTFLDSSGEALRAGIAAGPGCVKPNRQESEHLLGMKIESLKDAADAAGRLIALGARAAAISLGEQGLLWRSGRDPAVYHARGVKLSARSTVGCGDAAVAALSYASSRGHSAEESLALATACAAANCLADAPGAARRSDIERFRREVQVQKIAGQ